MTDRCPKSQFPDDYKGDYWVSVENSEQGSDFKLCHILWMLFIECSGMFISPPCFRGQQLLSTKQWLLCVDLQTKVLHQWNIVYEKSGGQK